VIYFDCPRQENPAAGQIFPHQIKSIPEYFTAWQNAQLHWLGIIEIVTGGFFLVAYISDGYIRRPTQI
jgi:hypothetical protein